MFGAINILFIFLLVGMFPNGGKKSFFSTPVKEDEPYNVYKITGINGYYFFTRNELFYDDTVYWGIMDDKQHITIPDKFVSICFIPTYEKNIVEVKAPNGKVGLYTLDGKQILPAEYDAFYPIYDKNLIAYYKKGDKYGFLKKNPDNSDCFCKKYTHSPIENKTIMNWNFKSIATYINEEKYLPIIFFPSFFFSKDPVWYDAPVSEPDVFSFRFLDFINGVYVLSNYVKDSYEEFFFITKNDTLKDKLSYSITRMCDVSNFSTGYKRINDTVIRLKSPKKYKYWIIKNGHPKEADYPGRFPQVKYEPITLEALEMAKYVKREQISIMEWYELYQKYPDPETLDTMRNEIYAYYGYKFKKPDWYNYFSKQKWYKPRYDKVELSPFEYRNVQQLIKLKKYLQEHKELYKPVKCRESSAG